jgi:hypothetical protein
LSSAAADPNDPLATDGRGLYIPKNATAKWTVGLLFLIEVQNVTSNWPQTAGMSSGCAFAGALPEIDVSFLGMAIDFRKLCCREVELLDRVQGVVELPHVAGSNQR